MPELLFKGKCPHCEYVVKTETFTSACDELIIHLQAEHTDELHKVYEHALNRAVLQGISCIDELKVV